MTSITLTKEEQKAIKSMQRLSKTWPQSLSLFSDCGTLLVCKYNDDRIECEVGHIDGIRNCGGDADDIEYTVDITLESHWIAK